MNGLQISTCTNVPRHPTASMDLTLFVPKLDTSTLVFQSGDGRITNDIDPFVERFLTSNGQHLKDGLRTLSLTTNYSGFNFGYLNSFKAFTKLDSLFVGTFGSRAHVSTSSLANFLHENKLWPDFTAIHLDNGYVDPNRCCQSLHYHFLQIHSPNYCTSPQSRSRCNKESCLMLFPLEMVTCTNKLI